MNRRIAVAAFRWILLILMLLVLLGVFWLGEDTIDRPTKFICPKGWWHTSEFWAHCAYPPVSIAKHGVMYAGYAFLSLIIIYIAAPSHKALASGLLLFAMMVPPAYHLVLRQFSSVEAMKLILVLLVAVVLLARERLTASRSDKTSIQP